MNDLKELQSVSFQEYSENKLIRRMVERTLHLAVEASLDIGRQVIASEGFRSPVDNKGVFEVLHEEGIVSDELLPALMDMGRFRNLIVHDYARVDDAAVFGILKRHLGDFDLYAKEIVRYLKHS